MERLAFPLARQAPGFFDGAASAAEDEDDGDGAALLIWIEIDGTAELASMVDETAEGVELVAGVSALEEGAGAAAMGLVKSIENCPNPSPRC